MILTMCFTVEILAGLVPLRPLHIATGSRTSAVIIVPAHDEASIIGRKLPALVQVAGCRATILLVADNCNDATAEIARRSPVQVIERFSEECRGKGFALDFARDYLRSEPPDVVLIIDADCETSEESIARLIAACAVTGSPCQASNLQMASPHASPTVQLSTFAFYIKNVIRQRALMRLAGRAHLGGTGMAIPWPLFVQADLATGNIVEDLKLGQDLADAGHAPVYVEQATIWSSAESDANTISQRRRWEGGFLRNALRAGPPMLAKALLQARPRVLWAALDTMIPPFALLVLLDIVALIFAAALIWLASAPSWPLLFLGGALVVAVIALALAWRFGGNRFVSLRSLVRAPFYVAWKLPMYLGLARKGAPKEWVRTDRP
ncbi:MAG: glycosyltransferase family 2 protein [Sphingomicrobium sp.]